jgi:hypothetical protein
MTKVTVGNLIEKLSEYGADVEVRIMHQQAYPLVEVVGGVYDAVAHSGECEECGYAIDAPTHTKSSSDYDHEFEGDPGNADSSPVIYLVANGHPRDAGWNMKPYGDRKAWDLMETIA